MHRPVATPHRVLFLAGGFWAIVAVGPISWDTGIDLTRSPLGDLVAWHAHEMVFGFASAMFAAYALTAMTSWSANARLSPTGVTILVALWGLSRLAAAGTLGQDPRLTVPAAAAFMAFVALLLARAALQSTQAKGAAHAFFALALAVMQISVLLGLTERQLPVLGLAALLSVVGGRMVAAFTWNQLAATQAQKRRFAMARLFGLPGSVAILLALWLATRETASGWLVFCLLIAAASEAMRFILWLDREVLRDGLLVMQHVGYSWLPVGLCLIALDTMSGAALHGLTAGAVACSIFAVAARAVARRADRLRPNLVDGGGFALLWTAAALRVFANVDTAGQAAAPVIWCIAWLVFLARHGATLAETTPRPVFSGPKQHTQRQSDRLERSDPRKAIKSGRRTCQSLSLAHLPKIRVRRLSWRIAILHCFQPGMQARCPLPFNASQPQSGSWPQPPSRQSRFGGLLRTVRTPMKR